MRECVVTYVPGARYCLFPTYYFRHRRSYRSLCVLFRGLRVVAAAAAACNSKRQTFKQTKIFCVYSVLWHRARCTYDRENKPNTQHSLSVTDCYCSVCHNEHFSILGFSCATTTGTLRSRSTSLYLFVEIASPIYIDNDDNNIRQSR